MWHKGPALNCEGCVTLSKEEKGGDSETVTYTKGTQHGKRKNPCSLEGSPKRNKGAAAAAADAADQTVIATLTEPKAKLVLDGKGNKLILASDESGPKKVSKDQIYKKWTGKEELVFNRRSALSGDGACLHKFSVTGQTMVYSQEAQKVLSLRDFVRKFAPQATSILGYKAFPAGAIPTNLEENKDLVAKIMDPLLQTLLKMCNGKKTPLLTWAVGWDKDKRQVMPTGLILVNPTQFSIAAKEEKVL